MHSSTRSYLEIAGSDDAIHAEAIALLRQTLASIRAVGEQAARKGDSLVGVRCDEKDDRVLALIAEGLDRQKAMARLCEEWRDRTQKLIAHFADVAAFDERLTATASRSKSA